MDMKLCDCFRYFYFETEMKANLTVYWELTTIVEQCIDKHSIYLVQLTVLKEKTHFVNHNSC